MKLQSIIEEIQNRVQAIDGSGDYHTKIGENCIRGRKKWDEYERPACSIFLGPRTKDQEQGGRIKISATIIIQGHSIVGSNHPEDIAIQMLSDIQRAVETEDTTMGGLLTGNLSWSSDQIEYPDGGGDTVSVQVEYEIPHIRKRGDPDN